MRSQSKKFGILPATYNTFSWSRGRVPLCKGFSGSSSSGSTPSGGIIWLTWTGIVRCESGLRLLRACRLIAHTPPFRATAFAGPAGELSHRLKYSFRERLAFESDPEGWDYLLFSTLDSRSYVFLYTIGLRIHKYPSCKSDSIAHKTNSMSEFRIKSVTMLASWQIL